MDEADVWRKIERLCELYEDALEAERAKNEDLELLLRAGRETAGSRQQLRKKKSGKMAEGDKQGDEIHG